jgi:anti-sigma B factor antagonist
MSLQDKLQIIKEITVDEYIIYLCGELDLSMAPILRAEMEPIVGQTRRALTLNLKDLQYMDSTGIGIMITMLKDREALNAPFSVKEIPDKIKKLFDITGVTPFFTESTQKASLERTEEII